MTPTKPQALVLSTLKILERTRAVYKTDPTRGVGLYHVHHCVTVEGKHQLEATQGYACLRVEFAAHTVAPGGRFSALTDLPLGLLPDADAVQTAWLCQTDLHVTKGSFPDLDQIYRPARERAVEGFTFDLNLLTPLLKSMQQLLHLYGRPKDLASCLVRPTGMATPMLLEAGGGFQVPVITGGLMPCRP